MCIRLRADAASTPARRAERAYAAARIAEAQRRKLIGASESFISETVFSHPSKVRLVADAVASGYLVHLRVLVVPVELAVQRVLERVRRGGHAVPEQKIRDHYERLWGHIAVAIQIADVTEVRDNSSARTPFRLCASFQQGRIIGTPNWPVWTPASLQGISTT